jgi:hypothetical protein
MNEAHHAVVERPRPPAFARGLAQERRAEGERFLASRTTSLQRLRTIVGAQIDNIAHLLLTSSPVHGLANATSDIDTICVVDGPDLRERTATQIFDGDNHYETILFSRGEVARALARLDATVDAPAASLVATHRTWDKSTPLTRKYLERLVNGVDTDGGLPYFDRLAVLAALWRAASFGRALAAAECAALAQHAGEPRGALGYVLNCCLYTMDALLSHHGRVYSNKKWYLLRFERFLASGEASGAAGDLARAVHAAWGRAVTVLADGSFPSGLTEDMAALMSAADRLLGTDLVQHGSWAPVDGAQRFEFLPGTEACLRDDQIALVPRGAGASAVDFGTAGGLDRTAAQALLRAIRAGLITALFASAQEPS